VSSPLVLTMLENTKSHTNKNSNEIKVMKLTGGQGAGPVFNGASFVTRITIKLFYVIFTCACISCTFKQTSNSVCFLVEWKREREHTP